MQTTVNNSELTSEELNSYWMPFTGNRGFKKDPRLITSAKGHYYTDDNGRKIFDGLSGLWTCGAGHNSSSINQAISNQLTRLDYAPAFQFSHPGAFKLAKKITEYMPSGLNRVFFTGSGSESVDTALKIARAYWTKKGMAQKTRFIGRSKGYHGVNFGGISVGGISANRAVFGDTLSAIHLPHTLLEQNKFSKGQPEHGKELAQQLESLIATYDASTIAAVIIEPLSGSAGVLPPPQGYLESIHEICTKHDILLIFDEVITAFGRMGAKTGAQAFGVTPDMMTIAKQLTNGVIPMGAVVAKQSIYDTFMQTNSPDYLFELPHGYTYSAHPVACAAALANFELLEQKQLISQVKQSAPQFEEVLHSLKNAKYVSDIRNYGLAGALTIEPYPNEQGLRPYQVAMKCWQKGFYVRFAADTIQLGLPFGVSLDEINNVVNAIGDSLNELD